MSIARLDFGIFLAPFHPVNENPTLSLQRDFEQCDAAGEREILAAALQICWEKLQESIPS